MILTLRNKKNEVNLKENKGKNRIAIIALIVATVGGVPGIFSIVNYFNTNRIIFGFELTGRLTGTMEWNNNEVGVLLIFGAVNNAGLKPLNPISYSIKVKIKDKWVSLQRMTMPEKFTFENDKQNILISNPSSIDLCRRNQSITREYPAFGGLMFIGNKQDIEYISENKKITFEISCVDSFRDVYKDAEEDFILVDIDMPAELAKVGVSFRPKEK